VQRKIDALMHDYDGDVPGAFGPGDPRWCAGGAAVLRPVDSRKHIAAAPSTKLPACLGHQAVHRGLDPALAEGGRLQLDDPIRKWLPSLPEETGGRDDPPLADPYPGV